MPRWVEDSIEDGAGNVQFFGYWVEDDLAEWPQEKAPLAEKANEAA